MSGFWSGIRALSAAAILLTGTDAMAELAKIQGTAGYRERIALRPGAVLDVELLDVPKADVSADRLASIRLRADAQVPLPFTLHYDAAMIEASHSYAVTAKIVYGDKVLFRSTAVHAVLTRGAGDSVDILMVKMDTTPPEAQLVGPVWVAEDIGGKGVIDDLQAHITFGADGMVSGSGGCNRFAGSYTRKSGTLALGPLAATSMACPEAILNQEGRFHAALAETKAYRIEHGLLFLLGEDSTPLMRLWQRD